MVWLRVVKLFYLSCQNDWITTTAAHWSCTYVQAWVNFSELRLYSSVNMKLYFDQRCEHKQHAGRSKETSCAVTILVVSRKKTHTENNRQGGIRYRFQVDTIYGELGQTVETCVSQSISMRRNFPIDTRESTPMPASASRGGCATANY
jgi:hypothetical protein